MISYAELRYVSGYARNVPYPGDKYALEVLEKLRYAFYLYQEKYQDKTYNLILSNGDEVDFAILPKNLCHILGVDFKNLTGEPMAQTREKVLDIPSGEPTSSYTVLAKIVERAEEVIQNDRVYSNFKILNYYKILIKCSIFIKLSDFTSFNFGCINFDKNIFNAKTESVFKPSSTKLFFTSSDEALIPYYMIGMTKDNGSERYVPETLFASTDFYNFFIKQELLVPVQLLINDNQDLSKIIASPQEKLNILKMYRAIIDKYNTDSTINIYGDYETTLRELALKKTL